MAIETRFPSCFSSFLPSGTRRPEPPGFPCQTCELRVRFTALEFGLEALWVITTIPDAQRRVRFSAWLRATRWVQTSSTFARLLNFGCWFCRAFIFTHTLVQSSAGTPAFQVHYAFRFGQFGFTRVGGLSEDIAAS